MITFDQLKKDKKLQFYAAMFILALLVIVLSIVLLATNTAKDTANTTKQVTSDNLAVSFVNKSIDSNTIETTINTTSANAMSVQGYQMKLNFDQNQLALQDIVYKFGVETKDLGSSNADLASINTSGQFRIFGEFQNPEGGQLSKNVVTVAVIKFKKLNSSADTSSLKLTAPAEFAKISTDGSLSKVKTQ